MNPNHLTLLMKAQAHDRSGNTAEAKIAYREFLLREPKHADGWADYGSQLLKLGELEEAQKACATALQLDPSKLSAQINVGCILMRRGRLDESEIQFRFVLGKDPRRMDALLFLAECQLNKHDLTQAQNILDQAGLPGAMAGRYSVLKPRLAELWALLGLALLEIRRFPEAENACNTALQIDPQHFQARGNLGAIQMAQGNLAEAEVHLQRLVANHPREEQASLLLITCLTRKGDLESADSEIAKVLQQAPSSFVVHKSLVGIYYSLGRWTEYRGEIARFRQFSTAPAYLDFEQSYVDLLLGDMALGWERYEARLKIPRELRPGRAFAQPAWAGEPFPGKTLLVWAEQGLGDTLMFVRYLSQVKALGGAVILEAQPALLDVAATCVGADFVVPKGSPLRPFDLQVSLLSLPWIFRTELSTIPAPIPYLQVPREVPNRQAIQEILIQAGENKRIGLVWAGSPVHGRDGERSIPATTFAQLAALPGLAWFSFQLERREVPPLPNLISLAPFLKNFSDTAFALSHMDLIITVDTSLAHLAGAMGIPTWALLSFQPDFRWLLDRDDSPWYPSLRLYRQPRNGDWDSVLRHVLADLSELPDSQRVFDP